MLFNLTLSAVSNNEGMEIKLDHAMFDLNGIEQQIELLEGFLSRNSDSPINIRFLEMSLKGLGDDSCKIDVPKLFWNGALKLNEFLDLLKAFEKSFKSLSGEDLHLDIAKLIAALGQAESVSSAIENMDQIILDIVHQPNMSRFQAKNYFVKKAIEQMTIEAKDKNMSDVLQDTLNTSIDNERFEKRYLENLVEFHWLEGTDFFFITKR